ncbi:hypothetical protein F183_A53190 [Bryobacterales bacterium F-183]|nr:hypothetical protein F183_A53190 [Bryobacterales bacterium F-183]
MWKWLRRIWIACGLGFTFWLWLGFQTSSDLPPARETSMSGAPKQGVIFLPGGMVAPEAYRPLMDRIRDKGFAAEIVPLPYRCACTDAQRGELFDHIEARMRANPEIHWAVGGHSRGGMLTARLLKERSGTSARGAVLVATTHPRDFDLAGVGKPILKIFGSEDGVASPGDIARNRHLLPSDAVLKQIDGGNHVQFGYYRHQLSSGTATITREQQQEATASAIAEFLSKL